MSFLFRDKTEMPDPADALPGRDTAPSTCRRRTSCSARRSSRPSPRASSTAIFGMGCFWGAERGFWQAPGVYTTAVGYAGGYTPNPTYEEVCGGRTGHNEVVLVAFRPGGDLLRRAARACSGRATTRPRACARATTWAPSTAPGSTRPRTPSARRPRRRASAYQERLSAAGYGEITTEIVDAPEFFYAEDYHQQYLAKNPNGYCGLGGTGVSCPVG